MTEDELELTVHSIGQALYKGDDLVRSLTPEEYRKYPKVLTAGNKAIENILQFGYDAGS